MIMKLPEIFLREEILSMVLIKNHLLSADDYIRTPPVTSNSCES